MFHYQAVWMILMMILLCTCGRLDAVRFTLKAADSSVHLHSVGDPRNQT